MLSKLEKVRMFDGCFSGQGLFDRLRPCGLAPPLRASAQRRRQPSSESGAKSRRLSLVWAEDALEPRPEWDQKLHRMEGSLTRLDHKILARCISIMEARRMAIYQDPKLPGKDLKRLGVLLWSLEQAHKTTLAWEAA